MTGGGGRQRSPPDHRRRARHRTEGVFSESTGREAWLSTIQMEAYNLAVSGFPAIALNQLELRDIAIKDSNSRR